MPEHFILKLEFVRWVGPCKLLIRVKISPGPQKLGQAYRYLLANVAPLGPLGLDACCLLNFALVRVYLRT